MSVHADKSCATCKGKGRVYPWDFPGSLPCKCVTKALKRKRRAAEYGHADKVPAAA